MVTEFDTSQGGCPGRRPAAVLKTAPLGDIDDRVIAVVEQLTVQMSRCCLFGSGDIAAATA